MGQSLVSFKGADGWRGRTTLAIGDRGDRRLVRVRNGYISSDGHEIRTFPGWRTLLDLTEENVPNGGYSRYVIDALRPVIELPRPSPSQPPNANTFYPFYYQGGTSLQQTLYSRAKPVYLHAFEQVGDTLFIIGESRFREDPIYTSARSQPTIESCYVVQNGGDWWFSLRLSGTPAGTSATDDTGAGMNGIAVGQMFYIEDLTVSGNPTLQALIDSNVNGRVHELVQISSNDLRFRTDIGYTTVGLNTVTDGDVHRVRSNRDNYYSTPSGFDPLDTNLGRCVDDLNALTSWRVLPVQPLSVSSCCSHTCYPAWVANRQRDFSDEQSSFIEGSLNGTQRGISRREQRELPYRVVPEPAGDRLIIAAPGYNCLFQVPNIVPTDPSNWPYTPTVTGLGLPWFNNDIYDKPRSLGIPKPRLIDAVYTPAVGSPGVDPSSNNSSHLLVAISASPSYGFPSGTYRMCATYQDDATGEEGPASEPIEFTVPSNNYAYYVNVHYFHPGYIMPECLALRMNIYLSEAGGEAMGFYKSFDLKSVEANSNTFLGFSSLSSASSPFMLTGKYGWRSGVSPTAGGLLELYRTLLLPLPVRGDLGERIDFTRLAPQASMPRGASCARYIRGVLVTVGHMGQDGSSKGLTKSTGSMILDQTSNSFVEPDQIVLRQHGGEWKVTGTTDQDGELGEGFGVAGRNFPDSCQGIEARSKSLLPMTTNQTFQVDRVLNRKIAFFNALGYQYAMYERLKTVRPVFDTDFATSPTDPNLVTLARTAQEFYWKMFKGQIQVGDPGAPWRVSKAGERGIQFMDPSKDDDGVAVYPLGGSAIICTRKETWFYSWHRDPTVEIPKVVSNEFGCIAPNSMVEFDGGVAWLSERGPVAMGASLQFVGADVQEDFVGVNKRYVADKFGMMRHSWGCHDASRGLILWGLITNGSTHTVDNGHGGTTTAWIADPELMSRAACDEVLIWSYRTNSFSTWVPPSGLEVLWMRPLRVASDDSNQNYETRICFLALDQRIYTLDETWQDTNEEALTTTAVASGDGDTTLQTAATAWRVDGQSGATSARQTGSGNLILIREGMVVQALNSDNEIVWETTISSADQSTDEIVLASAQTWTKGQTIRIGVRPSMVIETTYLGAEAKENISVDSVHVRYSLLGEGYANADVKLLKSDLTTEDEPAEIQFTPVTSQRSLGSATPGDRHGRRRQIREGMAEAPEIALKLTITSEPQVRITDLLLEV